MSERDAGHLSPGEIMHVSEGGSAGETVERHSLECAGCRADAAAWRETMAELAPLRRTAARNRNDCPTAELLAAWSSGTAGAQTEEIGRHVVGCGRCSAIIAATVDDDTPEGLPLLRTSGKQWQRGMAAKIARSKSHRLYAPMAAAAVILAAGAVWWGLASRPDPAKLLARAYTEARPFPYRLPDAGYPVDRQRGAAIDVPELGEARRAIRDQLREHPDDPSLLDLDGRALLMNHDYENAVETLQRANEVAPTNTAVAADLGCAYALRAEAENRPEDKTRAIDLFIQVLKKQPSDQRTRFNLALLYQRTSMVDEAIEQWKQFLDSKPDASWARDAREYLAEMEKARDSKRERGRLLRDPAQFLAQKGKPFDAELYQDVFWKEWLPRFASSKDASEAAALEARQFQETYGDNSLQNVMAEMQDAAAWQALGDVGRAFAANQAGETDRGWKLAARALEQLSGRGAGALRAQVELAYAFRRSARNRECLTAAEHVIRSAERASWAWLAGQAHLEHAACADELAESGAVRAELATAQNALEKSGLQILALRARGFLAGDDRLNGNYGAVWENALPGLSLYWKGNAGPARAQEFYFHMYAAAADLGRRDCAELFFHGAIRFVQQYGNRAMEADNRVRFASFLGVTGNHTEEAREVDRATRLLDALPPGPTRDFYTWATGVYRADAQVAEGEAAGAIRRLNELEKGTGVRGTDEQMLFHQTRGVAFMASGEIDGARRDFEKAIALNQEKLITLPAYLDRVAWLQSADKSWRGLTQIELARGETPARALAVWRTFRNVGRTPAPTAPPMLHTRPRLEVTYAVLPSGIAVFSRREEVVRVRLLTGANEDLQTDVKLLLRLCADPSSSETQTRAAGRRLYQALLGPELSEGEAGAIDIDVDSWLTRVPFQALIDDGGDPIGRKHPLMLLAGPGSSYVPTGAGLHSSFATLVSVPSATAPGGRALPFLSAVDRETGEVARRFQNATVLRGVDATVESIASLARRTEIFHFAGHGWANGGNGALILPTGSDGQPRFITARELGRQNWSRCWVAVLSACLTAAGEQRGAVNNESLVQALLGAGARRVVAARWSVDSEATRELMSHFYRHLDTGLDPASALAAASGETASLSKWSHPYYWAGFDVFGKDRLSLDSSTDEDRRKGNEDGRIGK